ncbi:MAG: DUF5688 family protein [Lachnospiraceae bacterium]|nr:DUF5688 family protein [Lachnospiraceae bacterium]
MNYDEFKGSVAEQIRDVLPEKYQDADVEIRPVDKINKRYEALFAKPFGENQSVAVNLEELYEQYAAGSMDFEDTLSAASETIQNKPQVMIDLEEVQNYEIAKERLFIRVCGAEQNEELLKNVPHRTEEDLAVTYGQYLMLTVRRSRTARKLIYQRMPRVRCLSLQSFMRSRSRNPGRQKRRSRRRLRQRSRNKAYNYFHRQAGGKPPVLAVVFLNERGQKGEGKIA